MENPETFLLKRIIGYKENGFESLGSLKAEYIKDLAMVMIEYAQATVEEVIERLNKGEAVNIGTGIIELKRKGRRSKNQLPLL